MFWGSAFLGLEFLGSRGLQGLKGVQRGLKGFTKVFKGGLKGDGVKRGFKRVFLKGL